MQMSFYMARLFCFRAKSPYGTQGQIDIDGRSKRVMPPMRRPHNKPSCEAMFR